MFVALAIVLICAATAAVYWPVSDHAFVYFDDTRYVIDNPHVHDGLRLSTLSWAFETDRMGTWHPLTWLSHAADWSLFGAHAGGHHATSLILHALNAVLLLLLLHRMTGRLGSSAFVALVFAVHPLNVASVAWVASRKGVLSAAFAFLTMLAYVRYTERPTISRYLVVVVAFGLGLLSKPVLVTLPALLLLLDIWPLERMSWGGRAKHGIHPWREKMPLLAMSFAVGVVVFAVRRSGDPVAWVDRLADAPLAYLVYLRRVFLPVDLATPYPPANAPAIGIALAAFALLAAITAAAWRSRKSHPSFGVGWLWFLITLLPVIGIVQVGAHPMADRWMYLPMIGVLVAVAWGVAAWMPRGRPSRAILFVGCAAIVVALAVKARWQVAIWKDTETLFDHAIATTENNRAAHYNLGWYFAHEGRADEAIVQYRRAIEISPEHFPSHHNLALVLWDEGRTEEAIRATCEALRVLDPSEEAIRARLAARLGEARCP